MAIVDLPIAQFDTFLKNLNKHVYRDPLEVTYNCDIDVNDVRYRLRLQVCPHRRLNPVQAVRLNKDITKCELVTDSALLQALTELVVAQYVEDK